MQHKSDRHANAAGQKDKKPVNHREAAEAARRAESERALRGVADNSETLGTSSLARIATRASDHMKAKDADEGDRVELWAMRTGRALSALAVIVLLIWLVNWLMR